jgi:hypothetical protein
MISTIRRGVLMSAAAGFALLGLGLGQASAALPIGLPALPSTALPASVMGPLGGLPGSMVGPIGLVPLDSGLVPASALSLDPSAPTDAVPVAPGEEVPVDLAAEADEDAGDTRAADLPLAAAPGHSMSDVDVAGLGSGTGPKLPQTNLKPNVSGSTLDGVTAPDASTLPTLDKITDGSALKSLDVTHIVPELGVLQLLPQLPALG